MSNSVNLDRWEPHLIEARRRGMTIAAYAREKGLSPSPLYAANQMVRRRDRASKDMVVSGTRGQFVAVKVRTPAEAAALRVQLPNGVALEMRCGQADGLLLRQLVAALGELPCSD